MTTEKFRNRVFARVALAALAMMAWMPAGALAQAVDPGLWEYKTEMRSMGGNNAMAAQLAQMQEQLRNVPPETRRMMEQQMSAMGLNIGIESGAVTVRNCLSPEEANADPIREGQTVDDCTYTQVQRKGNVWTGRMVCTDPRMTGDFTTTLHNRGHYSTVAHMKGDETGDMEVRVEGRRVAADCR